MHLQAGLAHGTMVEYHLAAVNGWLTLRETTGLDFAAVEGEERVMESGRGTLQLRAS